MTKVRPPVFQLMNDMPPILYRLIHSHKISFSIVKLILDYTYFKENQTYPLSNNVDNDGHVRWIMIMIIIILIIIYPGLQKLEYN